jgi:hypothetical protein
MADKHKRANSAISISSNVNDKYTNEEREKIEKSRNITNVIIAPPLKRNRSKS